MNAIAIYDMDKTITRAPTWTPFLLHAAWRLAPWRLALLPIAGGAALAYAAGAIDRAGLKQLTQRLLIGEAADAGVLGRVADDFARKIVARGVFADARERIDRDRTEGRRLVMATASFSFYAGAIAAALGFDDVIATRSERDGAGRVRARIAGENCYGAAKLRMIEAWFDAMGLDRRAATIRFYSDHVSDAPTFAWADEAVAVNPHAPLRAMATARGWQQVDWA
ncbi:MAG: haloacid dehalogenase [Sphingomonas sp. 28-66-16]|nr:MAG: haloacid dehalogenase [Sphingomonas sp. 28-66-16]